MVVAHPDDCVIFGWPIVKYFKHWDWTIVYLTHKETDVRAKEIKQFWQTEDIKTVFCGYEDHPRDLLNKKIVTFDTAKAQTDLAQCSTGFDIIVTHGETGEYHHPHHIFVHTVIEKIDVPMIYFNNTESEFVITEEMYGNVQPDLSKLPIHRSVIEMFQHRHVGKYKLSPKAQNLIASLHN